MKFRKKPVVVEANQFQNAATAPIGVFVRENGTCFVITVHEQVTEIAPGDWIILEPEGNGTRAYPCKPDIFEETYEQVVESVDSLIPVEGSSNVIGFCYDHVKRILSVAFKGNLKVRYEYLDVGADVFEAMKKAKSKGGFVSSVLKSGFAFRKINVE